MAIKVLLADDQPLTLQGIRRVLEDAGDIEIVGEARSGRRSRCHSSTAWRASTGFALATPG